MDVSRASWVNTTHDWSGVVDADHLARIRESPAEFAPDGPWHLLLEVLAYAADEASSNGGGRCAVVLHPDGSLSVRDDGRGTDTRVDEHGRSVKKPVMATKDLRFFDFPQVEVLPDGRPRRGMSVVAALSEWLVHTNRRLNGAWTQRYEHGVPVTGLEPVEGDGTTGTLVHFRPDGALGPVTVPAADDLARLATAWPQLAVQVDDRRMENTGRSGDAESEQPPTSRVVLLDVPVLPMKPTTRVEVRRITLRPGFATGRHTHNCPVFGSILEGSVIYQVDGEPASVLKPGDVFHEPEGVPVRFDATDEGATFLAYFLLDGGQEPEIELVAG